MAENRRGLAARGLDGASPGRDGAGRVQREPFRHPLDVAIERGRGGRDAAVAQCCPNRTFAGKIVRISSRAAFTPDNVQTPDERAITVR